MEERAIHITEQDLQRLRALIAEAKRVKIRRSNYVDSLEVELSRARVVAATEIPPDVVTMNSRVHLVDLDTHEEMILSLVFPQEADIAESKISVLAPIGTAMLGYRVGNTFTWRVPDGVRRFQVKQVLYQPEAAGDYEL
jgi:regulator of nucleoside diphosphate kinase